MKIRNKTRNSEDIGELTRIGGKVAREKSNVRPVRRWRRKDVAGGEAFELGTRSVWVQGSELRRESPPHGFQESGFWCDLRSTPWF